MAETTTTDEGLVDPGILDAGHPYCIALVQGQYSDPSDPKGVEPNEPFTVAGVIAAAKEEGA
jgi:hypothetical protein